MKNTNETNEMNENDIIEVESHFQLLRDTEMFPVAIANGDYPFQINVKKGEFNKKMMSEFVINDARNIVECFCDNEEELKDCFVLFDFIYDDNKITLSYWYDADKVA